MKRTKRQATDLKKIFIKDKSDKELLSRLYKELLKLYSKKTKHQLKNQPNILTDTTLKYIYIYRW